MTSSNRGLKFEKWAKNACFGEKTCFKIDFVDVLTWPPRAGQFCVSVLIYVVLGLKGHLSWLCGKKIAEIQPKLSQNLDLSDFQISALWDKCGTTHSLNCPKDAKNGFFGKFYIDIVNRKFSQLFFFGRKSIFDFFFWNVKIFFWKCHYRKILPKKNRNP